MKSIFPAIIVALLFFIGCSKERSQFRQLKASKGNSHISRQIALELKDNPRAIEMAIADFDCYGGSTMGWASWMLEKSSITSVDSNLQVILNDPSERISRRIEASWILRHRRRDKDYLMSLLELVKSPGEKAIQIGRRYLSTLTQDSSLHIILLQPCTFEIEMTDADSGKLFDAL